MNDNWRDEMAGSFSTRAYLRVGLLVVGLFATTGSLANCLDSGHRSGTSEESRVRGAEILTNNGVAVGRDYVVRRLVSYASGAGMIWVKQAHEGLPFIDSEAAFHFDTSGQLQRDANGQPWLGGKPLDTPRFGGSTEPRMDEAAARKALADHVSSMTGYSTKPEELQAELGIRKGALVWRICNTAGRYPMGYVSAEDGEILTLDTGRRTAGQPARRFSPPSNR